MKLIKTGSDIWLDSNRKKSPNQMKTQNNIKELFENPDQNEGSLDDESEYLGNDDTVYFKMSSYDHDEVEHFQNILKQTQTDVASQFNKDFSKEKSTIMSLSSNKKNQNFEKKKNTKPSSKNVFLMEDEELDFELEFKQNNSNSSYADVSIEREDQSNIINPKKNKQYSKTFSNHFQKENFDKTLVKENVKPWIVNHNKKKQNRFRSPRINLQKLNDSSKNSDDSNEYNRENFWKHRRRSGKIKIISNNRDKSSDEETEELKKEYIKLKRQLLELQKSKSKQNQERLKKSGNKTQRNKENNEKKATINPKKNSSNNKYVRFQIEENNWRRGKTPNHSENSKNKFYFEDVSFNFLLNSNWINRNQNHELSLTINSKNMREITAQWNKNNTNSLLIWKINKLENLKIVQGNEHDESENYRRPNYENRRGSSGIWNNYNKNDLKTEECLNGWKFMIGNKSVYLNDQQNAFDNENSFGRREIINPGSNIWNDERKIMNAKLNSHAHHVGIHIQNNQWINDGMNPYTVKPFVQSPLCLVPPHEIGKISVVRKIWCNFILIFNWIVTKAIFQSWNNLFIKNKIINNASRRNRSRGFCK